MEVLSLTRRKVQLQMLAEACEQRRRVRVILAGRSDDRLAVYTRFAALARNQLLLYWPFTGVAADIARDAQVEAFFEIGGQRLAFRTRTCGRTLWSGCRRPRVEVWKLTLPLCVERRQQRARYRVSLADLEPITARFTSVSNPQRTFTAELTNISGGGLCGRVPLTASTAVRPGELHWTTFELPEEDRTFEFIVRLVHVRALKRKGVVDLGGMFHPGEDPQVHRDQLRQLEYFVTRRERAELRRLGKNGGGGD
ncbi:MAG: PilZ domain-containing protein [Phycisphaerae bacterium]|nr:PilZ domain-containing protein [Phycisphaerae bacterium]